MGMVKRFDVYMSETRAMRPCVVLSPDEMNNALSYVIIAPITVVERMYPTRVGIRLKGKQGQIALDLMRTIPQTALKEKIGTLSEQTRTEIEALLKRFFAI